MPMLDRARALFRPAGRAPQHSFEGPETVPPPAERIERIRAVMASRRYDQATLEAYRACLEDARRAYGVDVDPGWTHPEIIRFGIAPKDPELAVVLFHLYEAYRPVRYGPAMSDSPPVEPLLDLLAEAYARWPMWRLHFGERSIGGAVRTTPRPRSMTDSAKL
jgi:hypothetical protein